MADQPPLRRRFQFRLRTLFVVMTVVAVTAMIWRTWGVSYYSIGYSDSEMMYHGFYIREGNLASLIATFFELIVILILPRSPLFRHRDRGSIRS